MEKTELGTGHRHYFAGTDFHFFGAGEEWQNSLYDGEGSYQHCGIVLREESFVQEHHWKALPKDRSWSLPYPWKSVLELRTTNTE